ncbi:MAG: putative CAMK family protein kinase [Streblomastix strix]|uniref:non-specific serine/threonine protein kinase n=1 Tax=Streblomastix strix TaxID=222440 RepID=A0A5J4VSG8_9EUKA|nr:MAG: putative CAMK family protein kinase [Streblomastix strix]
MSPSFSPSFSPLPGGTLSRAQSRLFDPNNMQQQFGARGLQRVDTLFSHESFYVYEQEGSLDVRGTSNLLEEFNSKQSVLYEQGKEMRPMYWSPELHCNMLILLLSLLVTARGTLDSLYSDIDHQSVEPSPYLPTCPCHKDEAPVNIVRMASTVPVCQKCGIIGHLAPHWDYGKCLCCGSIKEPGVYDEFGIELSQQQQQQLPKYNKGIDEQQTYTKGIASESTILSSGNEGEQSKSLLPTYYLAFKTIDVPGNIFDPCKLVNLFSEVCILARLRKDPLESASVYLDCGVDSEHYYVVQKQYECNLSEWRQRLLQFEPDCYFDHFDDEEQPIQQEEEDNQELNAKPLENDDDLFGLNNEEQKNKKKQKEEKQTLSRSQSRMANKHHHHTSHINLKDANDQNSPRTIALSESPRTQVASPLILPANTLKMPSNTDAQFSSQATLKNLSRHQTIQKTEGSSQSHHRPPPKQQQHKQKHKIRSVLGKKDLKSGMFRKTLPKVKTRDYTGRIYPIMPLPKMVDLYLRIFLEVVDAVDTIHSRRINHYDLKCANILLGQRSTITIQHLDQSKKKKPNPYTGIKDGQTTRRDDRSSGLPPAHGGVQEKVQIFSPLQHKQNDQKGDNNNSTYPCGPMNGLSSPPSAPPVLFTQNSAFTAHQTFWDPDPEIYMHPSVLIDANATEQDQKDNQQENQNSKININLGSTCLTQMLPDNKGALRMACRAARTAICPPLPFTVTVCDFGESALYATETESFARVDKGTECIKSPEMINAANKMRVEAPTYDRRIQVGADKKSDAWSLGCLLYELVTGYYLFHDGDNGMFQERIMRNSMDLLSGAKRKRLAETGDPRLEELLLYILQRDPHNRPTLGMIKHRTIDLLAKRHKARCQKN